MQRKQDNFTEEFKIIGSIQKNIQESLDILNRTKDEFYKDTLDFMNFVFGENCKRITQLKFLKFDINENVFIIYNEIIKKHKLNTPEFIIEEFSMELFDSIDLNDEENIKQLKLLICKLCNNLLIYLDYKIKIYNGKKIDKKRFILEQL